MGKIKANVRQLVDQLAAQGIAISGVTKATLGAPLYGKALLAAGIGTLADSRIENIETMRAANIDAHISLIRAPMLSQVARVVRFADMSLNSEMAIIVALNHAAIAQDKLHEILLMVELGDLREGIMPADLQKIVGQVLRLSHIKLCGIGTNLACRNGVVPDARNMGQLSELADAIEKTYQINLPIISGGNSSNLTWALGPEGKGRINHLRLGEAILLGREPLRRQPIEGLHIDAIELVAETIESKIKPRQPTGEIAEAAFGHVATGQRSGTICQSILALGHADTDPDGLLPPDDMKILGASSDHLVIDGGGHRLPIGTEVHFQLNYSALIRAMASPFVAKTYEDTALYLSHQI